MMFGKKKRVIVWSCSKVATPDELNHIALGGKYGFYGIWVSGISFSFGIIPLKQEDLIQVIWHGKYGEDAPMNCYPNETYFITPEKPEGIIRHHGQKVQIYLITRVISNLEDFYISPPMWELGDKLEGITLGKSIDKRIMDKFMNMGGELR